MVRVRVGSGSGRVVLMFVFFSNRQPATRCRLPIQTLVFESATESATRI